MSSEKTKTPTIKNQVINVELGDLVVTFDPEPIAELLSKYDEDTINILREQMSKACFTTVENIALKKTQISDDDLSDIKLFRFLEQIFIRLEYTQIIEKGGKGKK